MDFDLFYELAMPPFLSRSEAQAYEETMEEIILADELGFRGAWFVEHHFMRGYSHLSKPDLLIAALSQRTRRIRLGLGVIPLPLHHPVHVAERLATLDILTRGRLEVGIGRGFSPKEFAVFGSPMGHSRESVAETLALVRAHLKREPVTIPPGEPVDILPHAVQSPHPPLWSAAVSPQSFAYAAQEGLGVLAGPFKPWLMTRHDIAAFQAAWTGPGAPRIGMTVGIVCLPDRTQAKRVAAQSLTWFYRQLLETTRPVLESLYPSYEHFHALGRFRALMARGIHLPLLEAFGMAVAGTPDDCIRALRKYEAAGVTHLILAVAAGAAASHTVRESLRLIAQEVMPAFSRPQASA
ncbi:MAG: LLM class flavin-dependent oxidoreductase [Betaproteobacteria bacterium]|nr:LLM class flavin-dependent oxidoreductase [Betaproteobacteria bacterium]